MLDGLRVNTVMAGKQVMIKPDLNSGSVAFFEGAGASAPEDLESATFTNAIRDIADEDYISGAVRMLDVFLVVVCMAFGVGLVMALWARLGGVLA